ncbi:MAG TPA: sulfatase-like hydrolase/transferase [Chloroflexota bacterium]
MRTAMARGLMLGVTGGLIAGAFEAITMIGSDPVGRNGLLEAAVYALVIDALALTVLSALIALPISAVLHRLISRGSEQLTFALQVAAAIALSILLVGVVWTFPPPVSRREIESAGQSLAPFGLAAGAAGLAAFFVVRPNADRLMRAMARLTVVAVGGAVALALVLPIQVLAQADQPQTTRPGVDTIDMSVFSDDPLGDLRSALESLSAGAQAGGRPNVLLITVDEMRADYLGACGNEWIQTPAMDLLAQHAALACLTYPSQPQTNPDFASLFTSTYPATNGVRIHTVDRLAPSWDTWAKVMARNGYQTAGVIPWPAMDPVFSGLNQGFQAYQAFVLNEPAVLQNPITETAGAMYRRIIHEVALGGLAENAMGVRAQAEEDIDGEADVSAAATIEWLAKDARQPFFLWSHFFDPHYPFKPPSPWDHLYSAEQNHTGRYTGDMSFVIDIWRGVFFPTPSDVDFLRAEYASEISYSDAYVGQLLAYMARQGLLQNTIVILTSDNGQGLGERSDSWDHGQSWFYGDNLYDIDTRVPLIILDPRNGGRGQTISVPVQHVDVMPTVLDLLGIPIPAQAQGRSLVPLLQGSESGSDRFAITTLSDDRMTSIASPDGWKLIVNRRTGENELYNLRQDPGEWSNMAAGNPDMVGALQARLDAWARATEHRPLLSR